MAKIVVFDSGLGSLSVILAIQNTLKAEIIYFADQANYPYGKKSQIQLGKIIPKSIKLLYNQFKPDVIVVASNTPSLMLNLSTSKVIDAKPPLNYAKKFSKSKEIAILATQSATKSDGLKQHIKKYAKSCKISKINCSELVQLVESGLFLKNKKLCQSIIKKILDKHLLASTIDTVTLSSTHLVFLKPILEAQYPNIQFIDSGQIIARKILSRVTPSKRNSLKIFASGDTQKFQTKLKKLGIKNKVNFLSI